MDVLLVHFGAPCSCRSGRVSVPAIQKVLMESIYEWMLWYDRWPAARRSAMTLARKVSCLIFATSCCDLFGLYSAATGASRHPFGQRFPGKYPLAGLLVHLRALHLRNRLPHKRRMFQADVACFVVLRGAAWPANLG